MQVFKVAESQQKLRVVALPIGNLQEISPRALAALAAADLVVCEDTRVTSVLLRAHGLHKQMLSNEGSRERVVAAQVVAALQAGRNVVLVSDAGYPMLSDPGEFVIRGAYDAGYPVEVVNGPSSLMHAMVASGFGLAEFFFAGFLPARGAERKRKLAQLAQLDCTVVAFEAPHRITACLQDAAVAMGERSVAVCRELTKLHETIYRGTAGELAKTVLPKGELVIVFDRPARTVSFLPLDGLLATVAGLVKDGVRPKDACKAVAEGSGRTSRDLYAAFVASRGG